MGKKEKQKNYPKQYFEVLNIFHLAPDFKLSDFEKDFVKYMDKVGPQTPYDLTDQFDMRPSEVKEIVSALSARGVLQTDEEGYVSLTEMAIKYVRATKEERKTEKKFRKFLDTLDEADLEKLLTMVNSFTVKEEAVVLPNEETKEEPAEETTEENNTETEEKGE